MDKRTFLKITGAAGTGVLLAPWLGCAGGDNDPNEIGLWGADAFALPQLGFATDALAPNLDQATVEVHHGKHHAGYVRKLNAALAGRSRGISGSLAQLLQQVNPEDTAVRNNGGGHFNHSLYWEALRPGGPAVPEGNLAQLIDRDLGGIERFSETFALAGAKQFGSGWAWLFINQEGALEVSSTPNQDNPLMAACVERSGTPILGMDVWEHAYYLQYQNRRKDYIQAFLSMVNWEAVAARLEGALGQVK